MKPGTVTGFVVDALAVGSMAVIPRVFGALPDRQGGFFRFAPFGIRSILAGVTRAEFAEHYRSVNEVFGDIVDDERFVGSVEFRQNQQTFAAVRVQWGRPTGFSADLQRPGLVLT